jgi:hypothetical protein
MAVYQINALYFNIGNMVLTFGLIGRIRVNLWILSAVRKEKQTGDIEMEDVSEGVKDFQESGGKES